MNIQTAKLLVSIVGPTAVGKTAVAIKLAQTYNAEIISVDSRQFYREMNIGTAKPNVEELNAVPHHFINCLSVKDEFNVFDFERQALNTIEGLIGNNEVVIMAGGSGLYLHGIWNGFDENLPGADDSYRYELNEILNKRGIKPLQNKLLQHDPDTYNTIDLNNPVRLIRALEIIKLSDQLPSEIKTQKGANRSFQTLKIGLEMDRQDLYDRINRRVDNMVKNGLVEEAKTLLPFKDKNALKTVGYQELFRYFRGEISLEDAIDKIKVNSRRYAKRQMSWFRRYTDIEWFKPDEFEEIVRLINQRLRNES